jgi:hypothetical protein
MNYGVFEDMEKKSLIGFGRVKMLSKDLAWLEGGRVRMSLQKKGIGREMTKYAINYARKANAKIAQFDTSSRNLGSVTLAKVFGFKEKKSKEVLVSKLDRVKIQDHELPKFNKISAKEALEFYKSLEIGPGNEICVGWSYIPLEKKHLLNENWSWIRNSEAILQKIKLKSTYLQEGPTENELWMITYGEQTATSNLVLNALNKELKKKKIDEISVFCDLPTVEMVKSMGFAYPNYFGGKGERIRVVLFEKHLS